MFCYVYNSFFFMGIMFIIVGLVFSFLFFICVIVSLLCGFYRCDVIYSLFETLNKALSSNKILEFCNDVISLCLSHPVNSILKIIFENLINFFAAMNVIGATKITK